MIRSGGYGLFPARIGLAIAMATAVAQAAVSWASRSEWVGVWSATSAAAAQAVVITMPVTAFCMALAASHYQRGGLGVLESTASRPALATRLRFVLAGWLWAVAGVTFANLALIAVTAPGATFGRPTLAPLLVHGSMLLTAAAAGAWLGRQLPVLVAGPLAAVATYLTFLVGLFIVADVIDALTPLGSSVEVFITTRPWVRPVQVLVWTLIATATVAASAGSRRTALSLGLVAGLAAAPLLAAAGQQLRPISGASVIQCDEGPVTVCMTAPLAGLNDEVERATSQALDLVRPILSTPLVVLDDTATQVDRRAADEVERVLDTHRDSMILSLSENSSLGSQTRFDRAAYFGTVAQNLFPLSTQAASEGVTASTVLQRWFLESVDVPTDGSAGFAVPVVDETMGGWTSEARDAYTWLDDLSPQARADWFDDVSNDISDGSLDLEDFR